MKNVILITGGTGTLGEPLVKHFLSIGYTVIRTCAGDVCNDDGISLMTNDNKLLTIKAAENVIRILPPLNVKKSEIDIALKVINKVCSEY